MSTEKILETLGYITKKETLASIEHDTANALVLETREPYPGYHGTTIPDHLKPMSLFLVTDKKYSGEHIIRATMAVKKHYPDHFDATPGLVTVFNVMHPCIRIKDMASYKNIHELIEAYRKAGVEFMKDKVIEPFEGLIKIRKYFNLKEVGNDFYIDIDVPSMAYFKIPGLISWELFEDITLRLKPNSEYNNFDAALGVFFTPKGVIDTIRIYHEEIDMANIIYLRGKYLEEIERLF
ncbi:MAG: hypothetical protein IH598_07355 [Bacteroidales bacterium]|nr:hypothetical protein [Bacteroidales bacterium]